MLTKNYKLTDLFSHLHKRDANSEREGEVGVRDDNLVSIGHEIGDKFVEVGLCRFVQLRRGLEEEWAASSVRQRGALDLQVLAEADPVDQPLERPVLTDFGLQRLATADWAGGALLRLEGEGVERVVADVLLLVGVEGGRMRR